MESHKLIKPAKLHPVPPKTMPSKVKEHEHDYAMDAASLNKRDREDSAPSTPVKAPAEKRVKATEESAAQVSNNAIFEAIVGLEKRVDAQLDDIKEQTRQSSAMIVSLSKAVHFNAEEMKDCKIRVSKLESANQQLLKENDELKEKVREQERYRMRWCLRVKGLKEKKEEDIRAHILHILQKIVPELESKMEDAVDIVHRLGKREDNKTRNVIILFAQRRVKEEIWRRSKGSAVCREEDISFAEMLPKEDLEERRRLWPLIDEARKAGKQAFFRGPHGYIEGRRIEVNR